MSVENPNDVVDYFLYRSETGLTYVKLQRLLYFAQAWRLANFDEPLFEEDFEAWRHGPILSSVGKRFEKHGRVFEAIPPVLEKPVLKVKNADYLDNFWINYAEVDDAELEQSALDDAWKSVRDKIDAKESDNETISKELLAKVYKTYL